MILNNVKVSNEKISKIIEMGTGDINVSIARNNKEKYIALCLSQGNIGDIGRKEGNSIGLTTDEDTPDTMIVFKDIKSIDVVLKKLNKAKILLRNL